jgi:hypothetical protein
MRCWCNNINKQQNFCSLPKQSNEIGRFEQMAFCRELVPMKGLCSKRRILLYRLGSEQNFCCLLMLLSATYTDHIQMKWPDEQTNAQRLLSYMILFTYYEMIWELYCDNFNSSARFNETLWPLEFSIVFKDRSSTFLRLSSYLKLGNFPEHPIENVRLFIFIGF